MSGSGGWLGAFGLTLVIELPIYAGLLRRWCRPIVGLALGLVANLVTHPALWFGLGGWDAGGRPWAIGFVGGEIAVWVVEYLVLWIALRHRGAAPAQLAAIAGIANLASAGIGLLIALG